MYMKCPDRHIYRNKIDWLLPDTRGLKAVIANGYILEVMKIRLKKTNKQTTLSLVLVSITVGRGIMFFKITPRT